MAIAAVIRGTPLHDTTSSRTFTMTDAGTPTANRYLLAVITASGGLDGPQSGFAESFTGYGLTWTLVPPGRSWNSARTTEFWCALSGSSPSSVDPVATWNAGASSRTGCHIQVAEITLGSYPATALAGIVEQSAGVYTNGADFGATAGLTITLTLNSFADTDNRAFAVVEHAAAASETIDPAALPAWAELTQGNYATPSSNAYFGWSDTDVDVSMDFTWATSAARGGLVLELKESNPASGYSSSVVVV